MKWAEVLAAVLALAEEDAELVAALGGPRIRRSGEHSEAEIPGLTWFKMGSPLGEVTEPFSVQFDYFARELDQALTIERRLRFLFHRESWTVLGGISLSMQLEDDRDHADPAPGVTHRSLDFRFEPIRR